MPLVIRPVRPNEIAEFVTVLETATGRHITPQLLANAATAYDVDRTLAAFDGGTMVGGTGSELIELTVPGPVTVAAAKITLTGLLPTHRKKGIASMFFREQLPDLRRRGDPVAVLTTSQSGVPVRHGFGAATRAMAIDLSPSRKSRPGEESSVRVRMVDHAEARRTLPAVFEQHRRTRPGQVSRSKVFWDEWFSDPPLLRIGPSQRFVLVAENLSGDCLGYLTYQLGYGPLREQPVQDLFVEDLIALDSEAHRALWSYCLDFDQAARVRAWNIAVDDPILWMPSTMRLTEVTGVRHFLYLRLIDVPAALAARRYATGDAVALQVDDAVLPDNAGRYLLRSDGANASCQRTDEPWDVAVTVTELAAAYFGGVDFTTLARAGRIRCSRADVLTRLDAMFASRPAPWTVTDW
jgi:predicted acetyltransferase